MQPSETSPAARGRGLSARGALGLALALFAVWAAAFIRRAAVLAADGNTYYCLFDDAMISMRYAWNCAHGLGLVWNPGERVEGITNFLLTIMMIPFTALLGKPLAVLGVQIFGVGVMAAIAVATRRLAWRLAPELAPELRERIALFCAIAVLAWYPLAFCALMGLESALLTALLLGALLLVFPPQHGPARTDTAGARPERFFSPGLALLLGLAWMTRPDAAVPIAIIMLYRIATRPRTRRTLAAFAGECAIIALMVGGLTLFRWLYYGNPVPNTYRLKLGGFPLAYRLPQGLRYIAPFLIPLAPLLALAIFPGAREFSLLLALALAFIAYPAWIGGDALPHWRLMVPAFPLLVIPALVKAAALAGRFAARRKDERLARSFSMNLMTLSVIVILAAADAPYWRLLGLIDSPAEVTAAEKNVNLAVALNELTGPQATIAVTWGGIVPYYTGRRAIDLLGKSDPYLAALPPDLSGACGGRHDWLSVFEAASLSGSAGTLGFTSIPGHNKYDLIHSIVNPRPTYVAIFAYGRQDVRGFGREHYVALNYKGIAILSLLRGSPDVHWEKIPGRRP